MTIRHQQGKALHSTLNTVALIAIAVYLWYAGPEKPANQAVGPSPTQSAPQPVAPWDFRKGVLLDEPSDPNSWLEFIDRLNVPPEFWRDLHQPDRRILPFIEKTPETKESNVHANENRNQVSPRQLSVSEQEQDPYVAG